MKKRFLFISCEDAKLICDKMQYGEATGWERLKLAVRLSWCRFTKSYSKNNVKLTKAIASSEIKCLKPSERIRLQDQFQQHLSEHQ